MGRHFPLRRSEDWIPGEAIDREGSRLPGARRRRAGRGGGPSEPTSRKAMQLCHQVAVTLSEVLADCGDPLLQSLRVLNVEPAPDASRLTVALACDDAGAFGRVEDHLSRASGHLRGEIAQAITRKRAPVLIYHIAPVEIEA
ncbi:ribosome-binding factor A [Paludisphaera mucosa]|uniref:Ribosome-binding factor A n=1 Tax=Paludisphaera mucosa TaxID=3030827 RepID=A0ABT6FIJ1_9BACT|nr:ribosome-binding factor A [Paludisphaera mucosa]MDG3007354.1 ribosome-binding factor A [Paludisphaera mucosa]